MAADSDSRSTRDTQGADPMADHKRRARWRLLGAIIITGGVAAVAPILLEDQARPLSQDLLIEIPSKNSVFSKIESLKPGASGEVSASVSTEPSKSEPAATSPVAKSSEPAKPAEAPPVAEKPAEKKSAEKKTTEKPDKGAADKQLAHKATADKKVADKKAPEKRPDTAPTPKTGFLVQVGAYAKLESANAVRAKLTSGGHSVQVQTITLDDGSERHRVRIGPFETREQAVAVRDRAKSQGYDAVVVNPQ